MAARSAGRHARPAPGNPATEGTHPQSWAVVWAARSGVVGGIRGRSAAMPYKLTAWPRGYTVASAHAREGGR